MLKAALGDGEVQRIIEAQTAGLRDGQALLLLVPANGIPPMPRACKPSELMQRLDDLGSDLDLRGLLADSALGKGHLVVIATQDGGESAFLVP